MLKSLLVFGVLGVLLIPAKCEKISVCTSDNKDLRVDCLVEPKPNKVNDYQFSWSSGDKEIVLSTNVSGSSPDKNLKTQSTIKELKPHGYRMILPNFTNELPQNVTFLCALSGNTVRIAVEKDKLPTCSAVSVFLRSPTSWIICLLLSFYQTQS
ncbi:unnamed protein product [Tetraodon nigroviridis]|uniref:Chromosome 7 SCAF14601, whole genome shotgun sequence n=1 Tax=Tetraodon nigroviridis TaxID=99883 RepID=Q4SFS7_TETNG|nr:unnamed protein product [Tetraodon nigroviridis]